MKRINFPSPETRDKTSWLADMVQVGVVLAGVLIGAGAWVAFMLSGASNSASSVTTRGAEASIEPASTGTRQTQTAATCWLDSEPPGKIPCNDDHRYQAFGSAASCTDDDVRAYLGAASPLEVVSFSRRPDLDSDRCVIDAGRNVEGDFDAVLKSSHSAEWRACVRGSIDAPALGQSVSCDQPHQGEYISTDISQSASQADCERAAETYMNRSVADLDDRLSVRRLANVSSGPHTPQCVLWLTSGVLSSDSLYGLGNGELPR